MTRVAMIIAFALTFLARAAHSAFHSKSECFKPSIRQST